MCYYMTINLYNVDGFGSRRRKIQKMYKLGKAIGEVEKHSLSIGPICFQPPTVVEVDRFPSGSITLDKDTVGEHGQYFDSFYNTYLH